MILANQFNLRSNTEAIDKLIDVLSGPPANVAWSEANGAIVGTRAGLVITVLPHKVETAAVMAPDAPDLASTNANLLLLILTALRDDWQGAGEWLVREMRQAAQSTLNGYAGPNYARKVVFSFDKRNSRATLTIRRS